MMMTPRLGIPTFFLEKDDEFSFLFEDYIILIRHYQLTILINHLLAGDDYYW
jgi:hypothetical protein